MMGSHMPFHVAWHHGSLCVTGENRFLWVGGGVLHHYLSQPVCCKGQSGFPTWLVPTQTFSSECRPQAEVCRMLCSGMGGGETFIFNCYERVGLVSFSSL